MGLDCSHGCWHGAYSAFTRWRTKLAELAGYMVIKDYTHMSGEKCYVPTVMIDWGHLQGSLHGKWDKTPDDALLVLICHSDCEGRIFPEQAGPLANRLESLLPQLKELDDDEGRIGNWVACTQCFIDGLRRAASRNEPVDFH